MKSTITYVSTANISLKNSDIKDLMDFVRRRNNELGVTGVLLYSEGNFFQIMEGKKELIQQVFKKILVDARHYDIIKIFEKNSENTSFSKYHSSFAVASEKFNHNSELQRFLEKEKEFNPKRYQNFESLIQQFTRAL